MKKLGMEEVFTREISARIQISTIRAGREKGSHVRPTSYNTKVGEPLRIHSALGSFFQ